MAASSNSVFCTPDLELIKFYLRQAVQKSNSKCLQNLDQTESQKLVADFIAPAVQQCVTDASTLGNWKDEKSHVLLKIHGWFFLSWMTTKLGNNSSEMVISIGTMFYLEVLRICSLEEFLIQVCIKIRTTEFRTSLEIYSLPLGPIFTTPPSQTHLPKCESNLLHRVFITFGPNVTLFVLVLVQCDQQSSRSIGARYWEV